VTFQGRSQGLRILADPCIDVYGACHVALALSNAFLR
jgi:hypothetical protein